MSFIFYIAGILLAALGAASLFGVAAEIPVVSQIPETIAGFLIVAGSVFIIGGGITSAVRKLSKTIIDNLEYDDDRIPPSIAEVSNVPQANIPPAIPASSGGVASAPAGAAPPRMAHGNGPDVVTAAAPRAAYSNPDIVTSSPGMARTAAVSGISTAAMSPAAASLIERIQEGLAAGKGIKGTVEDLKASGAKHPATGKAWTLDQVQEIRNSM